MAPALDFEPQRAPLMRRHLASQTPVADGGADLHPLLTLQRQVGNAQIARMLAQREAAPEEDEEATLQKLHDPTIQREEAPPEEDEEEATLQKLHDPTIQREEAPPEEDDEQLMQASPEVGLAGGPVSSTVADQISSQRGGGAPLDTGLRSNMEGSFGTSFDGVRVHSDSTSHQLNHNVSAKAFTTGSDIFLGQGASSSDSSLMAHELTHVVQQRSMSNSGPMSVGPAGDSYEQQADAVASSISSGAAPAAQRRSDEDR